MEMRKEEVIALKFLGWNNKDIRRETNFKTAQVGFIVNAYKREHGEDVFTRDEEDENPEIEIEPF